jgi:hypothetical protein
MLAQFGGGMRLLRLFALVAVIFSSGCSQDFAATPTLVEVIQSNRQVYLQYDLNDLAEATGAIIEISRNGDFTDKRQLIQNGTSEFLNVLQLFQRTNFGISPAQDQIAVSVYFRIIPLHGFMEIGSPTPPAVMVFSGLI